MNSTNFVKMKKAQYFLALLFPIVLGFLLLKLTNAQSNVGIGLQITDTSAPTIKLNDPLNNSGTFHGNITFFYNVSDASNVSNCTLIINNKANMTNDSITKDVVISFRAQEFPITPYNWSINCTDILSNAGESAKRSVVIYSMKEFFGHGLTTNISSFDMRNVTNLILEGESTCHRINFSGGIDMTNGFDMDKHVNISFNRIELNSSAISVFNISATVQICNLTLTNPRIAKDGIVCPDTICKKVSYSGGILIFNVSHFTTYSAEETPAEAGPSPGPSGGGGTGGSGGGGGGGGGGPATPIVTDFSIDKSSLKIVLKQGQTKTETLSIKNTGTTLFDVTAFLHEIAQFKLSPESNEVATTLAPNEEKTIELVFKALENEKPDIYPSKISFKSPSSEKDIVTIVEVDSAEPLFDVDVEVSPESKKVFPGDEVLLEVNLFNVRGFGRVDVVVDYAIKDLQGNIVAGEHETLAVETQAKFTRRLTIPSSLKPGNYVAFAKVTYADSVGTSSDLFEVTAKTIRLYPIQLKNYRVVLIGAGGIAILASIVIFSAYKLGYLKKKAPKTKAEEAKDLKIEDKSQKLRKELAALEAAHSSGFISEESYQKSKERIQDKLNRLG